MALVFRHTVQGFPPLPEIQNLLIASQETGKLLCSLDAVAAPLVQCGFVYGDCLCGKVQLFQVADGFLLFVYISKAEDGEGNVPAVVSELCQLFKYTVDGVIVVGGEKHGLFIEKCGQQGIENGIGLACSRRPLDIGYGVFHGIVDGKELIQIDASV